MTFRFFRSLTRLAAAAIALAVSLSQVEISAQTPVAPAATPAATPKPKPKQGYIRFWNMIPRKEGALMLLRSDAPATDPGLITCDPQNTYAEYQAVPPARYKLNVVREKDRQTILQTLDVVMRADVYVSLVARSNDGKITVTLKDETYDPTTAVTGQVVVRNFLPDSTVTVAAGTQQAGPVADGGEQTITGLPRGAVRFKVSGQNKANKTWKWEQDVDLTAQPHATLMIIGDHYGNLRTRTMIDGYSISSDPDAAKAAKPASFRPNIGQQ